MLPAWRQIYLCGFPSKQALQTLPFHQLLNSLELGGNPIRLSCAWLLFFIYRRNVLGCSMYEDINYCTVYYSTIINAPRYWYCFWSWVHMLLVLIMLEKFNNFTRTTWNLCLQNKFHATPIFFMSCVKVIRKCLVKKLFLEPKFCIFPNKKKISFLCETILRACRTSRCIHNIFWYLLTF
jgi:hypothetical protein